ncbi:metallophosphoesterase [Cohnella endophytica]|uniref:Metallophosphoesterase n=1 Tax=Cohnella endophytica TaxID=2419778 RepID=A0A494X0P5_9BACL|nr:metallophosphoesterase family protein [Cohnella endophytica]RKP44287.1 metallophosphoesterase [Cohnella endophytica]
MSRRLRFRPDGTFTIVQFTDLHWKNGESADQRTKALMERVLAEERPDLIVFTGDVIESLHCRDPYQSFRDAVSLAESSGIPWAATFGNHDCEGEVTRKRLMEVQLEHSGSIAQAGPADVAGVGNFVELVAGRNGETAAALYFIDSGDYSKLPSVPGYGWIERSQIDWFEAQARLLRIDNGDRPVPSLAFFHIPLPEYRDLWNERVCYGHRYERVQAPKLNSGMFAAMVRSEAMMGTFCGHDHINDYSGKLHGIRLCYGRATGYHTYGRWLYQRGARVIRLKQGDEGKTDFDSWLRLANGKKISKPCKHSPNRFSRG